MLNPVSIIRVERDFQSDLSPLSIGPYLVRRSRLQGTPRVLYTTMHRDQVAGRQISYPSVNDCAAHVRAMGIRARKAGGTAALLDTALHSEIIDLVRRREMDARDLCVRLNLTALTMRPVLDLLVTEKRIIKRGTVRRPLYAAA